MGASPRPAADGTTPSAPAVRLPRQDRSREVWQRVLDAGVALLADTGVARFNVSGVCQRANVAMTAVYSRVDSRDELLHAVYEHGVASVQDTEAQLAAEVARPGAQAAVDVLVEVFRRHGPFLRAAVLGAESDDYLALRGRQNLARAREVFVGVATGPNGDADALARAQTLFTAAFSTLAFETAFGTHLVHPDGTEETVRELAMLAAALFPSTDS